MEATPYYPQKPRDIFETLWLFRHHVHAGGIPEELVIEILEHAQYWLRSSVTRSDTVTVTHDTSRSEHDYKYLTTESIVGRARKPVKRIEFAISAHDQGWSSFPECKGTLENAWTWFEVDVSKAEGLLFNFEGEERRLATNLHAVGTVQNHKVTIGDFERRWTKRLEVGDRIVILAKARFPGWRNSVYAARVDVYTSCLLR